MKRNWTALSIFWLTLLLFVPTATAQQNPMIVDEPNSLDEDAIMQAAAPLIARGATVAVYLVQAGEADEFVRRLQVDDLMRGELVDDTLIAVFVSLDDRYSEIRYGDNWDGSLRQRVEGLRSGMGGNLRDGAYTLAFTRTLEDIETILAAPRPTPASVGAAAVPSVADSTPYRPPAYTTSYRDDSSGSWSGILFPVGLFIVGIILQILFPHKFKGSGSGPRYKSSWSSGSRSSSHRSSISRSSSFGRGGRSGGKW